ncbi:hypothetical protein M5K25_020063 [Dendrobium thyrsiflorum]|uniref:Transposase Tc1-like domain-containing protein n=1 Tax=Dendrobium thyrsiflorum TaxID=117978 RepID=A0ABD0UFY6_DENTH
MSPNQGPEALLEVSNHDLDYQTIFKVDKLIVESSGSTRRIQRAQEHRIPTSLSQKIIHRTVHDQGNRYRPDLKQEERKRRGGRKKLLLDHRRSFAGPPPDAGVLPDSHLTPEFRRTTT